MLDLAEARANTVLMLGANPPYRVVDVQRMSGEQHYNTTKRALESLESRQIATSREQLGTRVYRPATAGRFYRVAYETALLDLPIDDAIGRERVYAVFAYGSLATPGAGRPDSDLDLFIIGRVRDEKGLVARFHDLGNRLLGRAIDPVIMVPEQVRERSEAGDTHVRDALAGVLIRGEWNA